MSLRQLRALALALPEVEERETWGHPTFRVIGKMFLTISEDGSAVTIKASIEEQAGLILADAAAFAIAAHVGRYGWITAKRDQVSGAELEDLVIQAWRRTAPRSLVASFDHRR
ncbi:MAG: MmcQ/YjbR family DNA-binding protein [Sulfobacillus sp.]